MTSSVGGNPLPESLSGPCRRLCYHEYPTHKVTKSQSARLLCTLDVVCVIVYVQFSSVGAGMVGGGGSSLHSGIEFGRSRTGKGSSGGEEEGGGVRSRPGAPRTILLSHIISASPSKQPLMVRAFLKVYMELGFYFLFSKSHHHSHWPLQSFHAACRCVPNPRYAPCSWTSDRSCSWRTPRASVGTATAAPASAASKVSLTVSAPALVATPPRPDVLISPHTDALRVPQRNARAPWTWWVRRMLSPRLNTPASLRSRSRARLKRRS